MGEDVRATGDVGCRVGDMCQVMGMMTRDGWAGYGVYGATVTGDDGYGAMVR